MLKIFKQYYPIRNIFFVMGEGLLIFTSIIFAVIMAYGFHFMVLDQWLFFKAAIVALVCQACLYYNDLYDLNSMKGYNELAVKLLQALGMASILLAAIYLFFPATVIGYGIFALGVCFIMFFVISWRFVYTFILNKGLFNKKIILLGSGQLAMNIVEEIREKRDCGYTIKAVIKGSGDDIEGFFINGLCNLTNKCEGLCDIAKKMDITKVIVAIDEKRGNFPTNELLACRTSGIDIIEGSTFYEMLTGKLIVEQIKPGWLIYSQGFKKSLTRRILKRSIDLILSITLLVLLSPLLAIVIILIKIDSKGPVIFSQDRVGENKKNYIVHKFRSMVSDAEKLSGPVWTQDDDPRITRVGKYMRKLRIDELPQIFDVLKGNMSFVGPRPEREFFVQKLESIIPFYRERFTVKPGISGWAQVSYGYGASVEDAIEKLNYDLFYIKNMSIFMDLMIVAKTVKIVLFGKGAR
jgi:sugar transferase (PEP-CTERM system associated)